jgi:hypothetical protein
MMTNEFKIRRQWLGSAQTKSEIDITLSRLQIIINERNVTEYMTSDRIVEDHLEIPAYYLAEWIAENWWPLLWEPRKSEEAGEDADFTARHSIVTAQNGFALPKTSFVPTGRNIYVSAVAREVSFADIRFRNTISATIPRAEVESELKGFLQKVVTRLADFSILGTVLQELWELIEGTTPDEIPFCEYIGALGLSPYSVGDDIEAILDRALSVLGERATLDLCLASTPDNFALAARDAALAHSGINAAQNSTLEPLSNISAPPENYALPAHRRGAQAAKRIRTKLGISDADPHGVDRLFELLKIDPSNATSSTVSSTVEIPISGLTDRDNQDVRIVLLQPTLKQRRFAAARAAYTAWTFEQPRESRLLTQAVTRDQQANRAFAAEMTSPFAFIRSQAKGSKISQDRIFEIAEALNIEPGLVRKHAQNNGLVVTPVY